MYTLINLDINSFIDWHHDFLGNIGSEITQNRICFLIEVGLGNLDLLYKDKEKFNDVILLTSNVREEFEKPLIDYITEKVTMIAGYLSVTERHSKITTNVIRDDRNICLVYKNNTGN